MATRKVTKIVKSWSNGQWPWPVGWVELECNHTATLELVDKDKSSHDDANHVTHVGDEVECERCDWYADKLAKIRALKPGDVSHSRFRTRDSRGIGDGDYYVYGHDPKSPTGCHLLFSIEATPEAGEALRAITASPLSPTERR